MSLSLPPLLPGGMPLLGHLPAFYRDRIQVLQRGYALCGPIFRLRLGPQSMVVLVGPTYHAFFFEHTDSTLAMDRAYRFLVPMFGEPVSVVAGPQAYREQRPVYGEIFSSRHMPGYVAIMAQEVQAWLDTLGAEGTFELVTACEQLTQHIAAHAFLGANFRQRFNEPFWHLFRDLVAGLDFLLPPSLPLPKFRRRDRAKRQLHAMLRPLLAERRARLQAHDDFLQTLVEARHTDGRPWSDSLIMSFILALMFAGYETTAAQTSWALILLLQHPDYLDHVRTELDAVLPPGQGIDVETLRRLPHVTWALREAERLHPASSLLLRYNTEAYELGGYRVPQGWLTALCPQLSHQLPEVFREPARYDPWRFAPGRAEDRQHPFALIGFGGGMHKCAGMHLALHEMSMIISLLLQQYDLELVTPDPQPTTEMRAARPTLCWVRYRRRGVAGTHALVDAGQDKHRPSLKMG
jgi:sterol 14-demethylase